MCSFLQIIMIVVDDRVNCTIRQARSIFPTNVIVVVDMVNCKIRQARSIFPTNLIVVGDRIQDETDALPCHIHLPVCL